MLIVGEMLEQTLLAVGYRRGAVAPYFFDIPFDIPLHTPAVDPVVQALEELGQFKG